MSKVGTPEEVHGVKSPQEYVALARATLVGNGAPSSVVRAILEPVPAYVSDGRWVVQCGCGNGPSAHPDWGIAVCLQCGSILTATFPSNRDTGEAILLAREYPQQRHWFPAEDVARRHGLDRAESVLALARENRARHLPVRRAKDAD